MIRSCTGWLIALITQVSAQLTEVPLPSAYLGATPYKNSPFGSSSIVTAFQVQRDIAINITIDHWLWPSINMSSAYFGTDYSASKLSQVPQVMLMGYRRLILDVYWDSDRRTWQLCPEAFPNSHQQILSEPSHAAFSLSTIATKSSSAVNGTPAASIMSFVDQQLGRYTCSLGYTFYDFMNSINQYLISTELYTDPFSTNLLFLILNLHQLSTKAVNTMQFTSNHSTDDVSSLKKVIQSVMMPTYENISRMYTPANLTADRRNTSIYSAYSSPYFPADNTSMWPPWGYLVEKRVQLLVGYGTNDLPSNTSYDISSDADTIFASDALGRMDVFDLDNTIQYQPGSCAIASLESWGFLRDDDSRFSYTSAFETASEPFSPNDTGHLADNILSTLWSWDVNQPQTEKNLYCAMVQQWNGRWRVGDCTQLLRVACRKTDDPFTWTLTTAYFSYDRAFSACPDGYVFDCPRLPVQSQELFRVIQADLLQHGQDSGFNDPLHHLFWINLNSATVNNCWVTGRFANCWWPNSTGRPFLVLIQTSVVAGVIILILVSFYAWVKCARLWRQRNTAERKHVVNQMLKKREYLTMPA